MWIALVTLIVSAAALNKVPLKRVESVREKLSHTGEWPKYNEWRMRHLGFGQLVGKSQGLKDYSDVTYVATVSIGTPVQTFNVIPDTGSSNLWIPDYTCLHTCPFLPCRIPFLCGFSMCDACSCHKGSLRKTLVSFASNPCSGKGSFKSKSSSTYKSNGRSFSIQYGTGSCSGFLGSDVVNFGGIGVTDQVFGQATSLAAFFSGRPFDGILGMGYQNIAEDNVKPVFNTMIEQNVVEEPIFGVYMTEGGGELTLGGIDNTKFTGDITYVSVTTPGYWQYNVDSVSLGGASIGSGGTAISDTGTSLLAGPSNIVSKVADGLKGQYDSSQGLYKIDCNSQHPDIEFSIDGKIYGVKAIDYTLKLGSECYLGFQSLPFGSSINFILGDCFHRSFYHVYDFGNNRVGFAEAVHQN